MVKIDWIEHCVSMSIINCVGSLSQILNTTSAPTMFNTITIVLYIV